MLSLWLPGLAGIPRIYSPVYLLVFFLFLRPLDHLRGADRLKGFRRDDKGRLRWAPEGVPWLSGVCVVNFAFGWAEQTSYLYSCDCS